MSRVLITGGAGFVGSHLVERLLAEKHEVICIDNLVTGKAGNLDRVKTNENLRFVQQDVLQPLKIMEKIDFVFHLASPASPVDYQAIPIETLLAGSLGMKNVLDLALKNDSRVVLSSTSEVYGDPLEHPQKETYWGNVNPTGERSCYDESKRFAEALCMAYLRKHRMSIRIARIFNTYGPRMRLDDGRVVPNFVRQALRGEPLTVYGDGKQTRSFCYVDDLVEGLMQLMFTEGIDGEVINLGNPDERTIVEFAKKIKKMTGTKSGIVFKPLPKDDPLRRKPDISKAKKLLHWEPKIALDDGLATTIASFKEQLSSGKKQ